MKQQEYEKDLMVLYGLAIKQGALQLALDILVIARESGMERITEEEKATN